MTDGIQLRFLRDVDHGGDVGQPTAMATALASFVAEAQTSVHTAIYDFRLGDALAALVVPAFTTAADRGVEVRIAYDDEGKPTEQTTEAFAELGADPAPIGTPEWLHTHFDGTRVELRPIDPGSHLMHDKYVIRDGASASAVVWTGSTNFTDDAWTHQENNVVTLASPTLATGFERDFAQLWDSGRIAGTGAGAGGSTTVGSATVDWAFAPADGDEIDARYAELIGAARFRIVLATMVLTSRTLLDALVAALDSGVTLAGVYDAGQMDPIVRRWRRTSSGRASAAKFTRIASQLSAKHSEPYTPTSLHNFLHHKVLVVDDVVVTGSFNLSRNATDNAENSLVFTSLALAHRYAAAISDLVAAYRRG
jgi:phosphatidylserine/phosphatidylglycerophosphate/cardiolipin synthase-like enzyme